jgi:hypothetical protein
MWYHIVQFHASSVAGLCIHTFGLDHTKLDNKLVCEFAKIQSSLWPTFISCSVRVPCFFFHFNMASRLASICLCFIKSTLYASVDDFTFVISLWFFQIL